MMNKFGLRFAATLAILMSFNAGAGTSQAGFVTLGSLSGNEGFNWVGAGLPTYTLLAPPGLTNLTRPTSSVGNVNVTGVSGSLYTLTQGTNWDGRFNSGDILLYSKLNSSVTIGFTNLSKAVTGIGFNIQSEANTAFNVTVEVLSASNVVQYVYPSLSFVDPNNNSNYTADGTALFVGLGATGSDAFSKIRFATNQPNGFAVNAFTLFTQDFVPPPSVAAAPAPASLILLLTGMAAIGGVSRFRKNRTVVV
jgi:hypothetical protein